MPFTLAMPKLSPTMERGTIVKWHKKEGDKIEEGDVLFEVATDKATVEYQAIDEGFLRKILVSEDSEAELEQPVAIFTEKADESFEVPEEKKQETPEEHAEEGKAEEKKEAPKAAPQTGGLAQPSFAPEPPMEEYTYEWPTEATATLASPLAKKLAKERGIDLNSIKGSGPNQRIMSRDLEMGTPGSIVSFGDRAKPSLPPGTYEEEKLTPMRKVIGEKLQASKTFIPHFYVQTDVDAEPMTAVREQLKSFNIKVTFNDLVLRAVALALKEHPMINSGYNSANNSIVRFKTIDISVAVSIPDGLITPIVRHADYKNLAQLSVEVKHLAGLAKKGKLMPEQFKGGSFTISNLGMYGIKDFQGVINPPQVSILSVGGIRDVPVVKNGQVVPGKVMTLSLSSDHRVVDGADGARFIQDVKKYLENPSILLI